MASPLIWFGNAAKLLKNVLNFPGTTAEISTDVSSITISSAGETSSSEVEAVGTSGLINLNATNGAGTLAATFGVNSSQLAFHNKYYSDFVGGNSYNGAGTSTLLGGRVAHKFTGTPPGDVVAIFKDEVGDYFYIFNTTASDITFTNVASESFNGLTTFILPTNTAALFNDFNNDGTYAVTMLGVANHITSQTSNYTIKNEDAVCMVDGSGGAFAITLPSDPIEGQMHTIKRTDQTLANAVTITGTIDGEADWKLHTPQETYKILRLASSWTMLQHNTKVTLTSPTLAITSTGSSPAPDASPLVNVLTAKRNGCNLEMSWQFTQNSSGTNGTGFYLFTLPYSLTVDAAKYPADAINNNGSGRLPSVFAAYNGSSIFNGWINVITSTQVYAPLTTGEFDAVDAVFSSASGRFTMTFSVPITGWKD